MVEICSASSPILGIQKNLSPLLQLNVSAVPPGLWHLMDVSPNPAINRWAILVCPYGTALSPKSAIFGYS